MHPQQNQPRRLLGDRDLEPPERLVHIAERGMQRTDPPGRDDASAAGRNELGEDSPRLAGVARGRLEVREPERGARDAARVPEALFAALAPLLYPSPASLATTLGDAALIGRPTRRCCSSTSP